MDNSYQLHREQYIHLLKADLARYPSAPDTLPGYERVPDFYVPHEEERISKEAALHLAQGVGNFRTLGVEDTRFVTEIFYESALKHVKEKQHLTFEEVLNQRMYGELFFADSIDTNQWKITVINRLYTLTYNWNITDNLVSAPELWVYTGMHQPSGWLNGQFPESHTEVQQLGNTLDAFRWSLYDEIDGEKIDPNRPGKAIFDRMTAYYKAHRKEYIGLRNEELAKYPELDEIYSKTFSREVPELKEALLSTLETTDGNYSLSSQISPYETDGSYVINNFQYMLNRKLKNYPEYPLTSWIAGKDIYSKQLAKHLWEIQFFYYKYAVCFHWNIVTDEISDLIIRTSEPAIDEKETPILIPAK